VEYTTNSNTKGIAPSLSDRVELCTEVLISDQTSYIVESCSTGQG